MASIHRTIVINRPVDQVFGYFADVTNDPHWRGHGVKEISVQGGIGYGARVHQKLGAGPFGAAVPGTEVSFSINAPLTGVKKALLGRMAQKNMAAEAAALDNAKRILEA